MTTQPLHLETPAAFSSNHDERRSLRRSIVLPVTMEWVGDDGDLHRARGKTRDVSETGIYCYLLEAVPVGSEVRLDVISPSGLTGESPFRIRFEGWILRVEDMPQRCGAVVALTGSSVVDTESDDAGTPKRAQTAKTAERRGHSRIVPNPPVKAAYAGGKGTIRDLSPQGAFIINPRPMPEGRAMQMHLTSDDLPAGIWVEAMVRRVEPGIGMGVEFTALCEEVNDSLHAFVFRGGMGFLNMSLALAA